MHEKNPSAGLSLFFTLSLRAETAAELADGLYRQYKDICFPVEQTLKFYSPELQGIIQKTIRIRSGFEKKNPGEKPPFADYSLLSPSVDSFQTYKIFSAKSDDTPEALVIVQLLYNPKNKVEPDFVHLYLHHGTTGWHIRKVLLQSFRYDLKEYQVVDLADRMRTDMKNPR